MSEDDLKNYPGVKRVWTEYAAASGDNLKKMVLKEKLVEAVQNARDAGMAAERAALAKNLKDVSSRPANDLLVKAQTSTATSREEGPFSRQRQI